MTTTTTTPEAGTDKQSTYADKIDKLLRKAESTEGPEAEAFFAKAMELMVTYAIDEEMMARARGEETKDTIVEEDISYTGIFQSALIDTGYAIARNNDCKCLQSRRTWEKPTRTILHVVGYKTDVDRVRLLDSSLQLQCSMQLASWWKTEDRSWMSKMQAFKAKRDFIFGFANGLGVKLATARKEAEKVAVQHEQKRAAATNAEAKTSVELVLRSKADNVKDWYDNKWGGQTRSVSRRYSSSGTDGRSAGHVAGRNADTGTSKLAGGRKAVTS